MEQKRQAWTEEDENAYRHLSGRAFAALDEHGETNLMKARNAVEKRFKKLGMVEDFSRRDDVKRFLVEFSDCETSYKKAAKDVGMSLTDLHAEFAMWPEGKMVRDYIISVKKELTRVQDIDDLVTARQTIRNAMRDGKDAGDAKAAMFIMSKLDKERFGDDSKGGWGEQRGKAQVVYNLPGLTLNMINAPKDMTVKLEKAAEPPLINI